MWYLSWAFVSEKYLPGDWVGSSPSEFWDIFVCLMLLTEHTNEAMWPSFSMEDVSWHRCVPTPTLKMFSRWCKMIMSLKPISATERLGVSQITPPPRQAMCPRWPQAVCGLPGGWQARTTLVHSFFKPVAVIRVFLRIYPFCLSFLLELPHRPWWLPYEQEWFPSPWLL